MTTIYRLLAMRDLNANYGIVRILLLVITVLLTLGISTPVIAGEIVRSPAPLPVLHVEIMHVVLMQAKADLQKKLEWSKYDIDDYKISCRDEGDYFRVELSPIGRGVAAKGSPEGMAPGLIYRYAKKTGSISFSGKSP